MHCLVKPSLLCYFKSKIEVMTMTLILIYVLFKNFKFQKFVILKI